jgi:tetratricopeptide (TPR) repeat protein
MVGGRPDLALEQVAEILRLAPGHPIALLVRGTAQRALGNIPAALNTLEPLARSQPTAGAVHFEYGLTLGAAGRGESAVESLRRAVRLSPGLTGAWLALADHLAAIGDSAGADAAYASHIKAATRDPRLLKPAAALCDNDIPLAEGLLRTHLKENPTDVAAIRMFAEVAARLGRYVDAENLLSRCLELAPSFAEARSQYALVLSRQNRPAEALPHIEQLLAAEPRNPNNRNLKATVLVAIGEYQQAIDLYAGILAEYPHQARIWLSFGHVLKTAGQQAESIRAYRKSLELAPQLGEAWWSLANLKTFRFSAADVETMRAQLARADQPTEDLLHLRFALGKASEDAEQFEESFQHYSAGNSLRRSQIQYSAQDASKLVERCKTLFTPEFFAARAGMGCPAPDPIFIIGLPRSGSTLLEQILSSHSLVEGTMELYDMISLARGLGAGGAPDQPTTYPDVLAELGHEALRSLGERYLERTRVQRKTSAPFFIDKMPNNLLHVGLIHLVLPNARIIDARRHPLGCCFSAFKQHFARGQHFSYSLQDVGAYYRDYIELMTHFDTALPGRVHHVVYESMIEDTEAQVRRLLDYCGLPFEAHCLRFYENERAVRTASSEQVRQPIFRDALEQWRHYEPWLTPLKAALGPILQAYPAGPGAQNIQSNT